MLLRDYERVLLCDRIAIFDHEEVIVIRNYPIRRYGTKWTGHENILNLCRDIECSAQPKACSHSLGASILLLLRYILFQKLEQSKQTEGLL